MEKHDGGRPAKNRSRDATGLARLSDLGVTKSESSRWQREAAVPEDAFEKWLAEVPVHVAGELTPRRGVPARGHRLAALFQRGPKKDRP
jgi:hypothetical protein